MVIFDIKNTCNQQWGGLIYVHSLAKFRREWLKHRELPVYEPQRIQGYTPEHQFLTELYVSIVSWSNAQLEQLAEGMGVPPQKRGDNAYLWTVHQIITDTFDVWEIGDGLECEPSKIERVTSMARRKAAPVEEIEEDEVEETKPARRRRTAAPKATVKAKPARKARAKPAPVEDEDEDDYLDDGDDHETPPPATKKKRSAKAKTSGSAKPRGASKLETIYVGPYEPVWDSLEDGARTKVAVAEEGRPFRGKKQVFVKNFLEERGRKKTSAQMIIDAMVEEEVSSQADSTAVVSHLINVGTLEVI